MSTLDWFRKPVADDPGTLNACYNALDRHVVRGRADEVALVDTETGKPITYARLLTQVAAFGGALKVLGVGPGDPVAWAFTLEPRGIVALLGCLRIGAVPVFGSMPELEAHPSRVVALDWEGHLKQFFPPREGRTIIVGAGDEQVDRPDDVVPWQTIMQAGNAQPAACEEVPGDALLWSTLSTDHDATMGDLEVISAGGEPRDAPRQLLGALLAGNEWSGARP